MRHLQSAISIWLDGPVDNEDIASLSSVMKDFEQELGIELCLEEPTRIRSRLSSSSVTYVDLRALLELPPVAALSDPEATRQYRLPANPFFRAQGHEDVIELGDDVDDVYDDDDDDGNGNGNGNGRNALRPTDSQVHLMVRRASASASQPVSLVVSLSKFPDEGVVTRIAGALEQVLGPNCHVFQLSKTDEERLTSGDECYLQTVEEIFQQYPPSVTGQWFAEGLAAERELKLGPGTGPLPVIYRDLLDEIEEQEREQAQEQLDEDDPLELSPGTRRVRWGVVVFFTLVFLLGWSFIRPRAILQWIDGFLLKAVEVVGKESKAAGPPSMEPRLEVPTPACRSPAQSPEATVTRSSVSAGDELFRPGISGLPLCCRADSVRR
jgi:hypothetical protein